MIKLKYFYFYEIFLNLLKSLVKFKIMIKKENDSM